MSALRQDKDGSYELNVAGHTKRLFAEPVSRCGHVRDGVGFHFEGEGGWVVSYQELLELLVLAAGRRQSE